jgi:hypothetical protein
LPQVTGEEYPPVDPPVTTSVTRRRKARADLLITKLSRSSASDISKYDTEEEEDGNLEDGDFNGIKHIFRDETWNTNSFNYEPKPKEFTRRMGTTQIFPHIPAILTLFELF